MEGSSQTLASTSAATHNTLTVFENNTPFYLTLCARWAATYDSTYLVRDCLIFSVVFLGTCFTMYGLYSLTKTGRAAPVYVINLFMSDIIQTTVKLIHISQDLPCYKVRECNCILYNATSVIYIIAVLVNICFMVCISAERYIMIAHPIWYRNINTIKISVFVSVSVWCVSVVIVSISWCYSYTYYEIILLFFFFLPYPSVIFFFVGTWRALSKNVLIPRIDKRRIMITLALVLCIYTILFLPYVIVQIDYFFHFVNFAYLYLVHSADVLMALNPLCDFLLYLLMRRDAKDILRILFFCHKRHEEHRTIETVS